MIYPSRVQFLKIYSRNPENRLEYGFFHTRDFFHHLLDLIATSAHIAVRIQKNALIYVSIKKNYIKYSTVHKIVDFNWKLLVRDLYVFRSHMYSTLIEPTNFLQSIFKYTLY